MGRVVLVLSAAVLVVLLVRAAQRRRVRGEPWSRQLGPVSWVPFVGVLVVVTGFAPAASDPVGGATSPGLLDVAAPTDWQTWAVYGLLLAWIGLVVAIGVAYRREVYVEARQARRAGEAPKPWFWEAGVVAGLWFAGGLALFMTVLQALMVLEERVYGPFAGPESSVDPEAAESAVAVLMGVMVFFGLVPFVAAGVAYVVQRARISAKIRGFEELNKGIERRVASAVDEARDYRTGDTRRPSLALAVEESTRGGEHREGV